MRVGRVVARVIVAVLLTAVLSACSGTNRANRDESLEGYTPEQIFERGEYELARNRTDDAAYYFSEIERLYPYSAWAKRALIMQAYSFHQGRDYPESRAAAQRYIDFYPADEDAAYAQYLLALSYYDQIDEVGRDQGLTFQALQALRTVIEVYPDSDYATTAVLKFDLAFDHLASKEMEIGRYYLRRQHYAAAINRFRVVVEDFQTTIAHRRGALPADRGLSLAGPDPRGRDRRGDPRLQLPWQRVVRDGLSAADQLRPRDEGSRRQLAQPDLSPVDPGPMVLTRRARRGVGAAGV